MLALALVLSVGLVSCGDDDDAASPPATTVAADENKELCDLAREMFDQEAFPTPAQIQRYTELAPAEIQGAVAIAGPAIINAGGDAVKALIGLADDATEDAVFDIDAWEIENCGIAHDPRYPKEANEIDPAAARVDVIASEYTFAFKKELAAGRTSFVMTNAGSEAHFVGLTRINEGHTLEEALAFEGDPEEAGIVTDAEYDSGLAAPGGEDEEVVTVDLPAGDWAMVCFIPAPDGKPHAFKGMAVPFSVT